MWTKRKLITERSIITRDLLPLLPNVYDQFQTRVGWEHFSYDLVDANEHMVKEFYCNVAYTKKDSTVTKVRNKIVVFSRKAFNEYLGFDDEDETQYNEKLDMKEEVRPWLAKYLAHSGTVPDWIQAGVKILRKNLNFEARWWLTFVCNRLDPTSHDLTIPLPRVVMIASIMVGFPINMGNLMYREITSMGIDSVWNYPYPNTLTMYVRDLEVKKKSYYVKVCPVSPFSWFSI